MRGSSAESILSLRIFSKRIRLSLKSRSPDYYHSAIPAYHHLGFLREGCLLENRSVEARMASAAYQFRPVPAEGSETYRSLDEGDIVLSELAPTSMFEEIFGS